MTRATWAVIPVKALGKAKLRLAAVLPPSVRRRLVLTMLEDVLASLDDVASIARIVVVTPDAEVTAFASEAGAVVVREDGAGGLNRAVTCGLDYVRGQGADQALVLPADVPLATPAEIRAVVEASPGAAGPRAVLVPSHDGDGTNALLVSPPDALEPAFGEGSFVRHLAQAVGRRLDAQVLHLAGLAADIDMPEDLARLHGIARYDFVGEVAIRTGRRAPAAGSEDGA